MRENASQFEEQLAKEREERASEGTYWLLNSLFRRMFALLLSLTLNIISLRWTFVTCYMNSCTAFVGWIIAVYWNGEVLLIYTILYDPKCGFSLVYKAFGCMNIMYVASEYLNSNFMHPSLPCTFVWRPHKHGEIANFVGPTRRCAFSYTWHEHVKKDIFSDRFSVDPKLSFVPPNGQNLSAESTLRDPRMWLRSTERRTRTRAEVLPHERLCFFS